MWTALKGWKWMPGMIWEIPDHHGLEEYRGVIGIDGSLPPLGAQPDTTKGATRGAILERVRELWGDPTICLTIDDDNQGWSVEGQRWSVVGSEEKLSEEKALFTALQRAG